MKFKTIASSIVIASLGLGSVSFAQPARHEAQRDAREARQDIREAQRDLRQADTRRETREARQDLREAQRDLRNAQQDRREARRYYNARSPEFRRGHRLPPELRQNQYVVSNWRGHHLSAPPRGYHWVQVGPDYVLAAIATGVITNLILGS
ncbi:RcnB family protein [Ramlibacter sp. USB13]|uniref:RcnB family protein n=1 Tax=Ramlibacter cellulosilyticus TaxID=2764187 RepID=A0A923SG64_9BURK|nr:RcnB family protein [Ramlibacter cellulosilyticus]MBC5784617.1 RcnB family protein [Ramlibacter cellulosilyticus]